MSDSKVYEISTGIKANITKILGIVTGVTGMLGAFLVSLLRSPEGDLSIAKKASDPWFWVVWAVIFALALSVILITYKTTKKEAKNASSFVSTLKYYKGQKDLAMVNIDRLPAFCAKKNKEIYEMIEREIVESADLVYADYKNNKYTELEKWQIKRLKMIEKIKIKKLRSRDLTQEYSYNQNTAYSFLPQSEKDNERTYLMSSAVNRALNTFVFLLVGSLAFGVDGWVSAITNSLGILFAWFGAVISANDYVNNTLRNRFIAKGDLLTEFNNDFVTIKEEIKNDTNIDKKE